MPELPRHVPPRRPQNWWASIRDAGFTGFIFVGVLGIVLLWVVYLGIAFLVG